MSNPWGQWTLEIGLNKEFIAFSAQKKRFITLHDPVKFKASGK